MNEIHVVRMFDEEIDMNIGYATKESNAKKMIDIMKHTDGFEFCEYEHFSVKLDVLNLNNEIIQINDSLNPEDYYTSEYDDNE